MRGLGVALEGAEQEGFRRAFTAGGYPVRELISTVAPAMSVYRMVVADLTRIPEPTPPPTQPLPGPDLYEQPRPTAYDPAGPPSALVEPLTQRELTVLRYLQGTLSNVEIAALLHVSVNTLKTHVKNIYRKLNTGHRRDAVRRARERRLL